MLLAILIAAQITYPPCPPDGEYISDQARLLSETDSAAIRAACEVLRAKHGIPLVLVSIRSMASCGIRTTTIERFATLLFDAYGEMRTEWAKGILLLVSVEDRKARIETGQWWGPRFDRQARTVMDNVLVPHFKRGAYGAGLVQGVGEIAARVPDAMAAPAEAPPRADPVHHSYNRAREVQRLALVLVVVVSIVIVVAFLVWGAARHATVWTGSTWSRRSAHEPAGCGAGGYRGSSYDSSFWSSGSSSSDSSGGGFSSGGSSGGGGGFSGGGGATGSW